MLLEKIRDVKDRLNLLEIEVLKVGYSWESIRKAFEREFPILSTDAIEKFKACLDAKDPLLMEKRKGYGRRKLPETVPSALDISFHVIDYLKTCKNMMASKADIFKAIKDNYPPEVQAVPHRSKGHDSPHMSALEYRLEWACTILALNKKAIGRNQDPKIPKKHIKLISKVKFTKDEVEFLKKNRNSLAGYK